MNDAIMIRTARDCAALAAKRFPEVADCDFRELFLAAILKAVAEATIFQELHEDVDDLN